MLSLSWKKTVLTSIGQYCDLLYILLYSEISFHIYHEDSQVVLGSGTKKGRVFIWVLGYIDGFVSGSGTKIVGIIFFQIRLFYIYENTFVYGCKLSNSVAAEHTTIHHTVIDAKALIFRCNLPEVRFQDD